MTTVPRSVATKLGLEPGTAVVQRRMLLAIDDEPLLTSTSYLPVELADSEEWLDAEVGQIALTGLDIQEASPTATCRMPIPEERNLLGMGHDVPVHVIYQPYRVIVDERAVPSVVVVTARADRVYLE